MGKTYVREKEGCKLISQLYKAAKVATTAIKLLFRMGMAQNYDTNNNQLSQQKDTEKQRDE